MRIVLRTVLERCEIHPAGEHPEVAHRRGITVTPSRGGQVILRERHGPRGPVPEDRAAVPAGNLAL